MSEDLAFAPSQSRDVQTALLAWFDREARDLPWRGSDDPYAVLVSEIMSQQTRIETVRDYWTRWMAAFPTIEALATASSDDVMKLWAGLGYYRRARNLHACAVEVMQDHGGKLPTTALALRELPGIGPYTSAAVASIVFGEAVAAIDGNVNRVAARLGAIAHDPSRAAFRHAVSRVATSLIDPARPGACNEALMELGAQVCSPRSPDCERCPVASWCAALSSGQPTQYPSPTRRKPPRPESRTSIVAVHDGAVFVRRGTGELLGGLWEFPTYDADLDAALELVRAEHGLDGEAEPVGDIEHIFSHIRMRYDVVRLATRSARDTTDGEGRWLCAEELESEALSVAMRRVASVVLDRL